MSKFRTSGLKCLGPRSWVQVLGFGLRGPGAEALGRLCGDFYGRLSYKHSISG